MGKGGNPAWAGQDDLAEGSDPAGLGTCLESWAHMEGKVICTRAVS